MRHLFTIAAAAFLANASAASAAEAAADAPERAADSSDKVICKKFLVTGSLVQSYKTCKRKGEWERERENLRKQSPSVGCRQGGEAGSC
jgi:hypothetical protein